MSLSIIEKIIKMRLFGKSPVGVYLRFNEWLWKKLPSSLKNQRVFLSYGFFIHNLVSIYSDRRQFYGTFFMRNRPKLELMVRLANEIDLTSTLNIAVLGCSNGAEVYSILWTLRKDYPDLKVRMQAMDISEEVLELAKKGVYSLESPELVETPIFERLTETEIQEMFIRERDKLRIQPWIKNEIKWNLRDASDPNLHNIINPQDIVVANNFLCHMSPFNAERCLQNISKLVKPDGYIFVSGIDLDVRTKVAKELKWRPVRDSIEDIHEGDPILRKDWPFKWWGLEPINKNPTDWEIRYAAVFQLGQAL